MIELVKKYIDDGNMSNALMVGQNLFNKNKGDKQVFSLYFSLLLDAANSNFDQSDKFIEQLVTVLSIYSENAELSENEVQYIRECEDKINKVVSSINEKREIKKNEYLKSVILNNDSFLAKAKNSIDLLNKASSRSSFNSILKDIYDLDEKLDKNSFVSRQRIEYEKMTNDCQKIVDIKLKQFDRLDNVEYNKKAVESYEKIFKLFKDAKSVSYKTNDIIELFSYDASRLTNETLIYYNYVYNYILSKLDDDQKLTMTKLSIIAEKKE